MTAERIGKVESGQDIAVYGEYLFDFVAHGICLGECSVYKISSIKTENGEESEPICRFILDKTDVIIPHCNTACFGNEFYEEGDEFPILYLNVYNTYQKCDNRREGMCCAYRIQRNGNSFTSTLCQIIEIDFVENTELWKSYSGREDRRPYGNFIVDRENGKYYGYVMRDKTKKTRYFSFDLPKVRDGEIDIRFGIRVKKLREEDINFFFDGEYAPLQGGCVHRGLIYSVSGGPNDPELRVIDPNSGTEKFKFDLLDLGIRLEAEGIEFFRDTCYYVAGHGDTYVLRDIG